MTLLVLQSGGCSSGESEAPPTTSWAPPATSWVLPTTDLTYCDAKVIIEDKCLRCHSDDGDISTPFDLERYDQITSRLSSMKRVIENGSMPFMDRDLEPPVEPLTNEEKELLLEWLRAGAPEGSGSCD